MRTNKCDLPKKSIDYLQDLIQVNIDSRDGFKEAADLVKNDSRSYLHELFSRLAGARAAQASELQGLVACNSESPTQSGSISAAMHRTWMNLREAFGGGEQALLDEAERGEDQIKAKYEEALSELGSCPCTETLRRQYSAVQASHDQIKCLRDQCAKNEHHHV